MAALTSTPSRNDGVTITLPRLSGSPLRARRPPAGVFASLPPGRLSSPPCSRGRPAGGAATSRSRRDRDHLSMSVM